MSEKCGVSAAKKTVLTRNALSKSMCDQLTDKRKITVPNRIICIKTSLCLPFLHLPMWDPTEEMMSPTTSLTSFNLIMNDYATSHELLLTA